MNFTCRNVIHSRNDLVLVIVKLKHLEFHSFMILSAFLSLQNYYVKCLTKNQLTTVYVRFNIPFHRLGVVPIFSALGGICNSTLISSLICNWFFYLTPPSPSGEGDRFLLSSASFAFFKIILLDSVIIFLTNGTIKQYKVHGSGLGSLRFIGTHRTNIPKPWPFGSFFPKQKD